MTATVTPIFVMEATCVCGSPLARVGPDRRDWVHCDGPDHNHAAQPSEAVR